MPHSLFVDTIRSLRALALGHLLGQPLMEEQDERVSLLERLVQHARATAQYNVYDGRGRDRFDVRGRTAHESLFNVVNGTYRGPSTQQGYSPFTTWTRGLAWAMLGFAEQLEFLDVLRRRGSRAAAAAATRCTRFMLDAARATCDHYIEIAAADGVPYWDAGAPGLAALDGLARSCRPIRSTIASRSTAPPRRSPRRDCCASRACWPRAVPTAIATSRPGCRCSTRSSTNRI